MNSRSNRNRKGSLSEALTVKPTRRPYAVGYAKPPRERRFKPGQSGNSKGRPKGTGNKATNRNGDTSGSLAERLKDIVLEETYRSILINEGEYQLSVPMAQAVVRSIAHNAAKGNTRAQRLFAEMVVGIEAERMKERLQLFETAIDYKQWWEAELARRERLGITGPAPLPHPDDVQIDPRTALVRIAGPMSSEEKRDFDDLKRMKKLWEREVPQLEKDLATTDDPQEREIIEKDLRFGRDFLQQLEELFPDSNPFHNHLQDEETNEH